MRLLVIAVALASILACGRERAASGTVDTSMVFVAAPASPPDSLHQRVDTTAQLGTVTRDLTGDGVPEILSLIGRGPTVDSMEVTFSITSAGGPLYDTRWQITRTVGFDAGRRQLSAAEHRARLNELGPWFFDDRKFKSPSSFVADLLKSARLHVDLIPSVIARQGSGDSARARTIWEQMQASPIIIFEFSPGGDAIRALGWSTGDKRFYQLLECC